jgi:hypothetical protein
MNSATFKFKVEGSDYQNLQDKAKTELAGFIEIDMKISISMSITKWK